MLKNANKSIIFRTCIMKIWLKRATRERLSIKISTLVWSITAIRDVGVSQILGP